MNIKLTNNPNLEVDISENFKSKANKIWITDCPKIDALGLFESVSAKQSTGTVNLDTIRLQLPCVDQYAATKTYATTGTYDSLLKYTTLKKTSGETKALSGYDSSGNIRRQPSLIGSWEISDYIDGTMAATLTGTNENTNDGKFFKDEPVITSKYHINWNDIAVQCVDETKPNYNPAVSIILNSLSFGSKHDNTQHFTGKWWITKDEASKIRDIHTWFRGVSAVEDSNKIVSDSVGTYQFTNFDAFSGFTGVSSLDQKAFGNNMYLKSVRIPNSVNSIPSFLFKGSTALSSIGEMPESVSSIQMSAFDGCSNLVHGTIGNNVTEIEQNAFNGCTNVEFSSLPSNLKYLSNSAFKGCSKITISEIPSSVDFVGKDAFNGCNSINSLHIGKYNSKVSVLSGAFDSSNSYPIYVGTNDSSCLSEKLIRRYTDDSCTSAYDGRLSSWYTKDYSALVPSDYEIQKYITSDGITIIDPTDAFGANTIFETDVEFYAGSGDYIHGSSSVGLTSATGRGVYARLYDVTTEIVSGYENTKMPHNYRLKMRGSVIELDGKQIFHSVNDTNGSGSIKFFGNDGKTFIGRSWMARTRNGVAIKDLVPVKRNSDKRLGLYDVIGRQFYQGGEWYTSDTVSIIPKDATHDAIVTENGLTIEF